MLSSEQVAKILNISRSSVNKMAKSGKLVATNEFGDWRFPEDELKKRIAKSLNRAKERH